MIDTNKIFIVGCPRSGTTLLQSLMSAHSGIISFPESHFFENSYNKKLDRALLGFSMYKAIKKWRSDLMSAGFNPPELNFSLSRKTMINTFLNFLNTMTEDTGGIAWIEKTPGHLFHIERITTYFNDVKFIHIVRDGREVVASLYNASRRYPEQWHGERTIEQCVNEWNLSIRQSLKYKDTKQHNIITYIDLTKDTKNIIIDLCEFIGVEFEDNMLEDFTNSSKLIVTDSEEWKNNNFSDINYTGLSKYISTFSNMQRATIENSLDMEAYRLLTSG